VNRRPQQAGAPGAGIGAQADWNRLQHELISAGCP